MSAGLIIRDNANTARTISGLVIRDGTNTPRTISELRVRDSNNVSRIVYTTATPMTASAAPETVAGFSSGGGTATTNETTVTPSGGVGPYTYLWALDLYDALTPPTCNSPTSATTDFTQTSIPPGESVSASWVCTVTDSQTNTAQATVNAFWTNEI